MPQQLTFDLDKDWHEVPQARFLSWTEAEQLAYCLARDRMSAVDADTPEEKQFYERRAHAYEEMRLRGDAS